MELVQEAGGTHTAPAVRWPFVALQLLTAVGLGYLNWLSADLQTGLWTAVLAAAVWLAADGYLSWYPAFTRIDGEGLTVGRVRGRSRHYLWSQVAEIDPASRHERDSTARLQCGKLLRLPGIRPETGHRLADAVNHQLRAAQCPGTNPDPHSLERRRPAPAPTPGPAPSLGDGPAPGPAPGPGDDPPHVPTQRRTSQTQDLIGMSPARRQPAGG